LIWPDWTASRSLDNGCVMMNMRCRYRNLLLRLGYKIKRILLTIIEHIFF
jgi:hypothetical protein